MLFKTYGYITMVQAHSFVQDLKLGLYLKIPQRVTFFGQIIATLWPCLMQLAVLEWVSGTSPTSARPANQTTSPVPTAAFPSMPRYLRPHWPPAHFLNREPVRWPSMLLASRRHLANHPLYRSPHFSSLQSLLLLRTHFLWRYGRAIPG
jgi:hypothetical protein